MKQLFFVLALLIIFIGCSTDATTEATVGDELTDSNIKVYEIDTFAVHLSTFKFDSIITSDAARIMVGQYQDPIFGKVRAASYFELISFEEPDIDDKSVFDSIALVLHYDHYFYADTTQLTELNIHRVLEPLNPQSDGYFYNTSAYQYDPIPLTTLSFYPEPFDEDSLYVPLPFDFGETISDKIRNGIISSNTDLTNELKGFYLQPGAKDNGSITGFSVNNEQTYLRFYYSLYTEDGIEEQTYDLAINTESEENIFFNQMSSDLEGTGLENLLNDQEEALLSEESGNRSFIHSGIGITTKIEFPTLKNIYNIPGTGTLMGCELRLYPIKNSYNDRLSIEDTLGINVIDQNNQVLAMLSNDNGVIQGLLKTEDSEFKEEYYSIQLGSYLQEKLAEDYITNEAIILVPNGYSYSLNRIILGDQATSEGLKVKLIIHYAVYQ